MRDQYAGDISDYLKLAFLRCVVPTSARLGVAWYYLSSHDGRPDGRHLEYLSDLSWRALDPPLFDALSRLPRRSVEELERLPIWSDGVVFHREPVPQRASRDAWRRQMAVSLSDCDAVFLDPDNGLSRGGVVSRKSATVEEVTSLGGTSRMTVLIRFPHRLTSHEEQLRQLHEGLASSKPITVRTCVRVPTPKGGATPRIRWFTALNADEQAALRISTFAATLRSIHRSRADVAAA